MWFRKDTTPGLNLTQGARYRRSRAFDMIEIAKIIAVGSDHLGIPHVHYSVHISGPTISEIDQRTLSLESFRNLYPEPLAMGV